jgi:hypothetical protein
VPTDSRPEGVVEMLTTSLRVFFLAMAVFAVIVVAFLLATA